MVPAPEPSWIRHHGHSQSHSAEKLEQKREKRERFILQQFELHCGTFKLLPLCENSIHSICREH